MFKERLALARRIAARHFGDEIRAIADDDSRDLVKVPTADGERLLVNNAANQRDRLRIGARQWLAERWAPEDFAPPSRVELTGKDRGPLLLEQLTLLAVQQIEQDAKVVDGAPPQLSQTRDE